MPASASGNGDLLAFFDFPDPDGARIELIADPLGEMCGHEVL